MQLQRVITIACFDANREFCAPEQGMSSPIREFGVIWLSLRDCYRRD